MIQDFPGIFLGQMIALSHFGQIQIGSCLFKAQHHPHFLLGQHLIQAPYFRIIRLDGMGIAGNIAVGDHAGQPDQKSQLLLVRVHIVLGENIIVLIYHSVFLRFHYLFYLLFIFATLSVCFQASPSIPPCLLLFLQKAGKWQYQD